MASSLKDNAYHVLGLDPSSNEKEILKRSKEILNRLQVGDTPEYDMDTPIFRNYRNNDAVKQATQTLQNTKRRIKEYFFWLNISDGIDEKAFALIKREDYSGAVQCWKDAAKEDTTKTLLYKKNLAILYCLVLSIEDNKQYLHDSVQVWNEVIGSEKFWTAFSKLFLLHNELTSSQELINEFRQSVIGYLSDIYTELHDVNDDPDYLSEFRKVFTAKGEVIEKSVLSPSFQSINDAIERLEKLEVSKTGRFMAKDDEAIKKGIEAVKTELEKLRGVGLYDDSQTIIMRDRAANALRGIVLDLHNNLSEFGRSATILATAVAMCGSESLGNKLKAEQEQIRKNIDDVAENSLAIEVPGVNGGTVTFTNTYVEYRGKKIHYKDAAKIAYYSQNTSINLIPISQSYSYWVASDKDVRISFTFSTTLYIGNKSRKDTWAKLAGISEKLIEPYIVQRLVDRVFDRGEVVKVGNIEFSKEGYSRPKLFGGREKVLWSETIYIPKFSQGKVVLWKDKNGKGAQFATLSMSDGNAVVLPQFIQACVNRH